MKLAGCLALVLAIVLGAWAGHDYYGNQIDKDYALHQLKLEELAKQYGVSPFTDSTGKLKDIDDAERYDAEIGIAAAVALIGAVALFAKGRKGT
jgi:hypothetical protein